MSKDTTRPIRYKTVQKNKKLGEFVADEAHENVPGEKAPVD